MGAHHTEERTTMGAYHTEERTIGATVIFTHNLVHDPWEEIAYHLPQIFGGASG